MKRRANWILRGSALFLVLALIGVLVIPRSVVVEVAVVKRGDFHEAIRSEGYLRSKEIHTVSAFADGDIRRVDLRVGDIVEKGQVITHLFWDIRWEPVRAPLSGTISRVYRESAGPIRRGEPIVEILDPKKLEVIVELLTPDAARVSAGNRAKVEDWGGVDAFDAVVSRVSKAGFTKQSALGVEEERTEVALDPVQMPQILLSRLGSKFHTDVSIDIAVYPNALSVPSGALFRDGEDWATYRVISGRAKTTRVRISARSAQDAMIES
ncbi:HlyD family efflux transporter periplasmic adaptor subunit, partial [bacterium]|nr:HlyD family efflux transporter periplasmic adaptor subunit [bacterium]